MDALLPLLAGASNVSQLASAVMRSLARKLPELKQQLGAAALAPYCRAYAPAAAAVHGSPQLLLP